MGKRVESYLTQESLQANEHPQVGRVLFNNQSYRVTWYRLTELWSENLESC
jgi:hypothetical protein